MANRFWVAGTETWNSTAGAKWGTLSGVADSASLPGTGDIAIFDALSGGGTVTVDSPNGAGVVTVQQITMGAFTGTLDFSANDNNVTLSTAFSGTGTGTRTLNMGDGTWTLSGVTGNVWDCTTVTNFTFNANSSRLLFQASAAPSAQRFLSFSTLSYNIIEINDPADSSPNPVATGGAATIATLILTNVGYLQIAGGVTTTITNGFSWNRSSSAPALLQSQSVNSGFTLSVGGAVTMDWIAIQNCTKSGAGSITATNSFNLGGNTGVTITSPSGGARIVSG